MLIFSNERWVLYGSVRWWPWAVSVTLHIITSNTLASSGHKNSTVTIVIQVLRCRNIDLINMLNIVRLRKVGSGFSRMHGPHFSSDFHLSQHPCSCSAYSRMLSYFSQILEILPTMPRKAHTKSRNGCIVCKRRHVKACRHPSLPPQYSTSWRLSY